MNHENILVNYILSTNLDVCFVTLILNQYFLILFYSTLNTMNRSGIGREAHTFRIALRLNLAVLLCVLFHEPRATNYIPLWRSDFIDVTHGSRRPWGAERTLINYLRNKLEHLSSHLFKRLRKRGYNYVPQIFLW